MPEHASVDSLAYLRDWTSLPSDILKQIVPLLDKQAQGSARLACKTWQHTVEASINDLHLGSWPSKPQAVARFTTLSGVALRGPYISHDSTRVELVTPLLISLSHVTCLRSLDMAYAGPGCLENIDVLTGLTSLSLSHAGHDAAAASMDHTMPGSSMPSMAAAPAGSSSSGGSTGRGGRPSFGLTCSVLPAAMSNLQELQVLKLENIPPSYEVLMPLTTLKQLELRGQTLRDRAGMLIACNPLPGVGGLTSLTALVARCNYGINRLPNDLGSLSLLEYLDVSKNMLWSLPPQITQLVRLTYLDLSSNCLASAPEELGELCHLTFLDLSNNSRVSLPRSLSRLNSLKQLNMNWVWSDMAHLWDAAKSLPSLETLNVVGNGIITLPPAVGQFKALRTISLSMNNLTELPVEFGQLVSLASIEASDNRLTRLPPSIGCLTNLNSLGLRSNSLRQLPDEIGNLRSLCYLDVSMNHISVSDRLLRTDQQTA
eukprot:jgi/Chrzof1/4992/Cz15g07210.t1